MCFIDFIDSNVCDVFLRCLISADRTERKPCWVSHHFIEVACADPSVQMHLPVQTHQNLLPSFIERKSIYDHGDCQVLPENQSNIVSDLCLFGVFKGVVG